MNTTFKIIEDAVSHETNLGFDMIYSKSRRSDLVFARRMICVFAKKYLKMSLMDIARQLSLDHSTVIHHLRNFEYDIAYDSERRVTAKNVENEIQKRSVS